jgi:catechol 2,3-dioxygenase-like lactoylglutathione lyase family enzyme
LHLATVRHVKSDGELTWVELDTSETFLPVLFEHDRFPLVLATRADAPAQLTADVVGASCGFDVLAADARLPAVVPGDVLAFLGTGAYQDAAASNFNALPRPATVLVHGARAELVKRRETVADVFRRDLVPARLTPPTLATTAAGLDHVSVTVASIDASLRFYSELLGLAVRDRSESSEPYLARITGFPGARLRFADLELPDGHLVELIEFLEPRGKALGRSVNHPGAAHISFAVENISHVYERLLQAGVTVRSSPVLIDEPGDWKGARCFYAEDPDGFTVELIERVADRTALRG